jgi:hypothetical protein
MPLLADDLPLLAHVKYCSKDRDAFRRGVLVKAWSNAYPSLFDQRDIKSAEHQSARGYHFVEWLTAVYLFEHHGMLSLQASYPYKSHPEKRATMERVAGREVTDFFTALAHVDYYQAPDLFAYTADGRHWCFVEVKGPRDRLRERQLQFFDRLIVATGAQIRVVTLSVDETVSSLSEGAVGTDSPR